MARGKGDSRSDSRGSAPPAQPFDPQAILATLERHKVEFVVIGAFGAVVHGWNESTSDIDITPNRQVVNLQRLVDALRELEAQMLTPDGEIDESLPLDDQTLRLRETTFLTTRYGDIDVVINPAAAGGYPDLARASESVLVEVGGVQVRVAKLERIIASKRASDRPKDRDALPRLEELMRRLRGAAP